MIRHILRIAVRNFLRNRIFAFINIIGLSFGLATFIMIALYIQYEYSWDKFHQQYKRIYALQTIAHLADGDKYWSQISYPVSSALKAKFPEVREAVVTRPVWGEYLSTSEDLTFYEDEGLYSEQSFFNIFTVEFVEGGPEGALIEPYSIVLTESLRDKYFEGKPALGKFIRSNNRYELKVTGVIRDFPGNSSLDYTYISPIKLLDIHDEFPLENQWDNFSFSSFLLLHEQVEKMAVDSKIGDFLTSSEQFKNNPTKYTLWLNPLESIHLLTDPSQKGLLLIIYLYSGIAIFALLIACVNFMNLTTAYSASRAREIGIKKVSGSSRRTLGLQFLSESVFVAMVSMILAFILAEFALPYFNGIVSRSLDIRYIQNWQFIVFIILITLLTGVISGSYPAFFLSGFKPIQALKQTSAMSSAKSPVRKILVTFQFLVSSVLILCTLVIIKQFYYMKNMDPGFNKDRILHAQIDTKSKDESRKFDLLRSRLEQVSGVESAAVSQTIPFFGSHGTNLSWEGAQPDETVNSRYNFVGYDFINTLGLEIVKGRDFSREITTDEEEACLINETAARTFGWEDPIDKKIKFWEKDCRVVGVVRDFHPYTVFERIPPYVFRLHNENIDSWLRHSIRVSQEADIFEVKKAVTEIYQDFFPGIPFDFKFLSDGQDDVISEIYQGIVNTFLFFSIVTIAIAAIGMFGLVTFSTKARTKEIGIRKVHGASAGQVFILIAREFFLLIMIAIILSFPTGIGMKAIDPAAYKPETEVWEYLLTGLLIFLITLVTITFQTRKASVQNPAQALRYE
jgi:putative ABC transport system permease protein